MSKTIEADLKTHMAGELTTIATCWKVVRVDGTEYFFTDHDTDLVVDGDTYGAAVGVLTTQLVQDRGLGVDNMEAISVLDSEKIAEADIHAGLFDLAVVDIFQVNYEDLTMGVLYLVKGWTVGNIEIRDETFAFELRGKGQRLGQSVNELYSPTCRATLGDARCGVDTTASAYLQEGSVSSVTDNQIFIVSGLDVPSDDLIVFDGGLLTWTEAASSGASYEEGANAGLSMEVKEYDSVTGQITLFEPMANDIEVGDDFQVVYGCNGDYLICDSRFGNILNFRGEPWIPSGSTLPIEQQASRGSRRVRR